MDEIFRVDGDEDLSFELLPEIELNFDYYYVYDCDYEDKYVDIEQLEFDEFALLCDYYYELDLVLLLNLELYPSFYDILYRLVDLAQKVASGLVALLFDLIPEMILYVSSPL
ncbi:MAG: hypothetical protein EZS28_008681, partial [Streblomastix strix]